MIVAVVRIASVKKLSKDSVETRNQYDFLGLLDEEEVKDFIARHQVENPSQSVYEVWRRV